LTIVLAAFVAVLPNINVAAKGEGNGNVVTGGLSVGSDPVGANVFLDGKFAGRTPLSIDSLATGDHRVLVVKDGYLENSRLVNVTAGAPRTVDVKLTKTGDAPAAAAQVTGGGGGGGSKKWIWIGAAAAAGGGTAFYLLTKNSPPVAGTIGVSPTATGMAGQTTYTFSSTASDPDDDPLTYNWNFGDGSTGTGASPTKVYAAPGTYSVALTVSDGKKSASAPAGTVVVGQNITATWAGGSNPFSGCFINWALTQAGTNLTGSMIFVPPCGGTLTGVTGTVSGLTHPATVSVTSPSFTLILGTSQFPSMVMSFSGKTVSPGASMTGTLTLRQTISAFVQATPATYTR
jgi:PKD repeat protein